MKITGDTIEYIADLAKLNLTEEEKSKLILDMERNISYMDKLNELDTSKVKPTDHVIPISNVFREPEEIVKEEGLELMKETRGKADPQLINKILKDELDK